MSVVFTHGELIDFHFVKEEYIPITVIIEDNYCIKHIGFYYKDSDLCEFAVDFQTNNFVKFVLTTSSHYEFLCKQIKISDAEVGRIQLDYPSKVECSFFKTDVYNDGVHISLSNTIPSLYYRTGNFIIGLNNNEDISDVYIVGLTDTDIAFIKNELSLG